MLSFTIREALEGTCNTTNHYLYLYRDGDVIFYVGRSISPLDRLRQHLALEGPSCGSSLGDTILDNLPESWEWTLEIYTLAECLPFIEKHNPGLVSYYHNLLTSEQTHIKQLTARKTPLEAKIITDQDWLEICQKNFQTHCYECLGDDAEKVIIEHYNPCINILGKTRSNPLPSRYIKRKITNEGVKISEEKEEQA